MLDDRSLEMLDGVDPSLVAVVRLASNLTRVPFIVTEGLRSEARQEELVKAGASTTYSSKHLQGRAVDVCAVVDGKACWAWPKYLLIANAFKKASQTLGIATLWGGDWKSFKDGCHFELAYKRAPAQLLLDVTVRSDTEGV